MTEHKIGERRVYQPGQTPRIYPGEQAFGEASLSLEEIEARLLRKVEQRVAKLEGIKKAIGGRSPRPVGRFKP